MPSANHWHRDLVELTVDNLALLIKAIFNVMEKGRISKHDIRTMISLAAQANQVDVSQLKPKMRQQIMGYLGVS